MPCVKCQKHVTFKSGITCTNYGVIRGNSPPCQGAWCAECFSTHELDTSTVAIPRDFNGASLAEVEDEIRFSQARPGDHVCCAFQCPNCQSQNIRGTNITPGDAEDEAFVAICVRATLDAFWSRSSRTVSGHIREVKKVLLFSRMFGIRNPFPRLGPFPKYYHGGMLQAMMVVMRAMDPGGKRTLKWGSARKNKSTFFVIWQASPESGGDITLENSKGYCYTATCAPGSGSWYKKFSSGCCARMGDIVRQDRAFTIGVLHKLLEMYESEFQDLGSAMPLFPFSHACFFYLLVWEACEVTRLYGRIWLPLGTMWSIAKN